MALISLHAKLVVAAGFLAMVHGVSSEIPTVVRPFKLSNHRGLDRSFKKTTSSLLELKALIFIVVPEAVGLCFFLQTLFQQGQCTSNTL